MQLDLKTLSGSNQDHVTSVVLCYSTVLLCHLVSALRQHTHLNTVSPRRTGYSRFLESRAATMTAKATC